YDEALRISTQQADTLLRTESMIGLGKSQRLLNNQELSLESFRQALDEASQLGSLKNVCASLHNIGINYLEKNEFDISLDYLIQALDIANSNNIIKEQVNIYLSLGMLYVKKNNFEKALSEINKSFDLSRQANFEAGVCNALIGFGKLYIKKGDLPKAIENLQISASLSNKLQDWPKSLKSNELLSSIFSKLKQYDKSLARLNLCVLLKDSIFEQNKANSLADMHILFQLSEKQDEIELKKHEITFYLREKQLGQIRTGGLWVLVTLTLILGILLLFWQRDNIQKNKALFHKQQEVHSARQAMMEAEFKTNKIEKQKLQNEFDFKHREITNFALFVIQKNEYLKELSNRFSELLKIDGDKRKNEIKSIIRRLKQSFMASNELENVSDDIEQINHQFLYNLNELFPDLSENEKRLCGFFRLGLSNKEISTLNNISHKAVEMARYRMRKKMRIESNVDLVGYLKSM
ncbi:MAG: LuxR C-terminal-related transcriptional regulator, partial [Bacteroidota bacterium]|nr:LuxR C-terminal-related transcriptional regulator [Bacteroidota bacterium]